VKTYSRASSVRFSESTISKSLFHENCSGHGSRRGTLNSVGNHNHLYDIKVLEEEEFYIKIHYVGYSSQYDE